MRRLARLAQLARGNLETVGVPCDGHATAHRALTSAWLAAPWGQPPQRPAPAGGRRIATHAAAGSAVVSDALCSTAAGPVAWLGGAGHFPATDAASTAAAAAATATHPALAQAELLSHPAPLAHPVAAHTSLEDSLALFLSPTQLGAQLWEGAHSASGLPWWAAIPAATLALRAALLPLSLRAYAASANVVLLHRAVLASRRVAEAVADAAAAAAQRRRQEQEGGGRGAGAAEAVAREEEGGERGGRAAEGGGGGGGGGSKGAAAAEGAAALGRLELIQRVAAHLRAAHRVPSFGWYLGSAAVQVPLVVSLTLALRRMCDSLWPGLTGEGLLYFTDLTAPPVYLQTLSTPYGTAGAILPLALVLLYVSAVDRSAGGSSPGIHVALKLLALPLYCAALLQPHAVLLYWLSAAAGQLGTYAALERLPALRRAAGVPAGLLPPAAAGEQGGGGGGGAEADAVPLDELLLALADSYGKAGNRAAAAACLEALLARQPGHEAATERLQALQASTTQP